MGYDWVSFSDILPLRTFHALIRTDISSRDICVSLLGLKLLASYCFTLNDLCLVLCLADELQYSNRNACIIKSNECFL